MMRSSTSYFLTLFLAKNSLATWQTEVIISGYWSYRHLLRASSLASSALAIVNVNVNVNVAIERTNIHVLFT